MNLETVYAELFGHFKRTVSELANPVLRRSMLKFRAAPFGGEGRRDRGSRDRKLKIAVRFSPRNEPPSPIRWFTPHA